MSLISIRGWLRENERLALRRWSFGKVVLEMGAYEGLSTCNIASTAAGLVTVDTFDGRGTPEAKNTEEILWKNLEKIERCPVQIHKGLFSDVLPRLDRKFDLIFIDGSHDYESVRQDISLAEPLLNDGGAIAFHDYCTEQPGVLRAVDDFVTAGAVPVAQADTLLLVKPRIEPAEPKPGKIVIGMPHRDGSALFGSVSSLIHKPTSVFDHTIVSCGHSILTLTFNEIFSQALNLRDQEGFTHFAMLHNDIVPCEGWVDILMSELIKHDLDMLSAVVPLKNERGLTSTGTDTLGNPWTVRRLTMSEVMQLPQTFTAADVPHREENACLLLNSGCWVMKLNEPWVKNLWFRQQDKIAWCKAQKQWGAFSVSEDWDFSRQLFARGCRLGATRKVPLYHQNHTYNNQEAWGAWSQDEDFLNAERETAEYKAQHEPEMACPS